MDEIEVLGGNERFLGLEGDFAEIVVSQRAPFDHFINSAAGKEFHHHVGSVLVHSGIKDSDNVRMLDRAEGGGLLEHGLGGLFLIHVSASSEDALDRHFAIKVTIEGTKNGTDPTLADLCSNFVAFLRFHVSDKPAPSLTREAGDQYQKRQNRIIVH